MRTSDKAKRQITLISKYCQTLDFDREHQAEDSNSVYFKKGIFKIRISDHFGVPNKNIISIVVSSEDCSKFIVSNTNRIFIIDSLHELKSFILSSYRLLDMADNIANQKNEEMLKKITAINNKYNQQISEASKKDKEIKKLKKDLESKYKECAELEKKLESKSINIYGAINDMQLTENQKSSLRRTINSFGVNVNIN